MFLAPADVPSPADGINFDNGPLQPLCVCGWGGLFRIYVALISQYNGQGEPFFDKAFAIFGKTQNPAKKSGASLACSIMIFSIETSSILSCS